MPRDVQRGHMPYLNPEDRRAARRLYYQAHKDKISKSNAEWKAKHPELGREISHRYLSRHRQELREKMRMARLDPEFRAKENAREKEKINTDSVYAAKRKAKNHRWRAAHPEIKERYRERTRIATDRWTKANPERVREYQREWRAAKRAADPEFKQRDTDANKRYYDNNIDRMRTNGQVRSSKRRAKKAASDGSYTEQEITDLFIKQGGKCHTCKCKIGKSGKSKYHVDHIQPLSRGGSNSIDNIGLACQKCNLQKRATDPFEWANKHGLLFC